MATHHASDKLLPVPNPTSSYWRSELHYLDSYRSTAELPEKIEIVIIGAGIAGVSVAYHLSTAAKPPSILLLEARQTCSGATGRNGGHSKSKATTLMKHTEKFGAAAADEFAHFVWAHSSALKEVIEKEEIDCEFELRRSYDVFKSEDEAARMEAKWKDHLSRGCQWTSNVHWTGSKFAERLTSIKGAKGAFSVPACSMWPYKFVTGLLERAMRKNPGLNLQTETPVLEVQEQQDGQPVIRTSRGSVKAKKVIFATNAYSAALLPEYRNVITPYKGTATHLAAEDGWDPVFPHLSHTYNIDFGVVPGTETVDYLNPRPDGGIVVGGGNWIFRERRDLWYNTVDDSTLIEPIIKSKYFCGYIQRNFMGWEDSGTGMESIWTGIQGLTPDGLPHVGKVPGKKALWILAGFNGGGMAFSFLSAKAVAKMALDDVPFHQSGVKVPKLFETTEERLQQENGM
ncbi:FAD dependent oxidoreductase [Diaporthe helianthi]|uniref:FAD dependent oxidoreductase n=1 Tax=Diaporthe helianthi TaxID=158607 RepID=A0A2P5I0E2_DIAHE|nr:FAD dependent oxidoreductase [Diaporthe helianthi]